MLRLMRARLSFTLLLAMLCTASGEAQEKDPAPPHPKPAQQQKPAVDLKGVQIGGLWYISYQQGDKYAGFPDETSSYSVFRIKRGYIDIRTELQPWLDLRITPDITQDSTGDIKVRIKYLYARFKGDGNNIISEPYAEVGVAHMPWLDFEEHVNRFRMQDTMFMERNQLFNSADIGFLVGSNFGPELSEEFKNTVNSSYAGRYGSWQFGVFNGGGYHASERNNNKVLEGRATLRPAPDNLPGLQFSILGVYGKGNLVEPKPPDMLPDYEVLAGMVSYEHEHFVLTGQWYSGEGNAAGTAVPPQNGSSYFAEIRLTRKGNLSLIGRYDRFNTNSDNPQSDLQQRGIVGFAWQMFKNNYWVIDYERLSHSLKAILGEDRLQVTLQIRF